MKTNLAYIDDVMDRAVAGEFDSPTIPPAEREKATKDAKKLIGGFRVHDHAAERKSIDDLIARRRAGIEKFRADRDTIRSTLAGLGVTPLAVCPTGAWYKVCRDAGLFILNPDKNGHIQISRKAFEGYTGKSAEKNIDSYATAHWADMLKLMMPDGLSLAKGGVKATLILPDPPADVADTLCKAQGLKLTVAAVGEAISFAEKPSALMKEATANPKDVWAREQGYEDYQDWLKRDPIIFTEHETATAIIAQFGDFPIEKAVVDAAIGSDTLLAAKPNEAVEIVRSTPFADVDDMYRAVIQRDYSRMLMERDGLRNRELRYREEMEHARYLAQVNNQRMINSADWTGR